MFSFVNWTITLRSKFITRIIDGFHRNTNFHVRCAYVCAMDECVILFKSEILLPFLYNGLQLTNWKFTCILDKLMDS